MEEKLVTVGRLGRTRGVAGELYIVPETDFPERFLGLREIYVKRHGQWEKLLIESTRFVSGRPVIKFENVNTPEEAARLTNREMAVPKEEIYSLPEGRFYIHDLIGCRVFDDQSGDLIGEIVSVETYPANDVYEIRTSDGKNVVFPAVEKFVRDIDLENRKVVIVSGGLFQE